MFDCCMFDLPSSRCETGHCSPCSAGVLIGPVEAQVVCYEGFGDYAAGAQVESGGNGSEGTGLDGGIRLGRSYDVSNAIKSLVRIENRTSSPVNYDDRGNRPSRAATGRSGFTTTPTAPTPCGDRSARCSTRRRAKPCGSASSSAPPWRQPARQSGFFPGRVSMTMRTHRPAIRASASEPTPPPATFPSAFQFFARSTTAIPASAFHGSLPIAAATTYLLVGRIQPNVGGLRHRQPLRQSVHPRRSRPAFRHRHPAIRLDLLVPRLHPHRRPR